MSQEGRLSQEDALLLCVGLVARALHVSEDKQLRKFLGPLSHKEACEEVERCCLKALKDSPSIKAWR